VAAVDRHVVDDEVAFSDEVVVLDGDLFTEIVNDRREDLFPTLSALRTSQIVLTTCGVVHQVFGDKFVDDGVITCHYSTKQLFDDILRFAPCHPLILPAAAQLGERPRGSSGTTSPPPAITPPFRAAAVGVRALPPTFWVRLPVALAAADDSRSCHATEAMLTSDAACVAPRRCLRPRFQPRPEVIASKPCDRRVQDAP
jgi:hypothetical protein